MGEIKGQELNEFILVLGKKLRISCMALGGLGNASNELRANASDSTYYTQEIISFIDIFYVHGIDQYSMGETIRELRGK